MTMDADSLLYRIAFASLRGMNVTVASEWLCRVGSERDFFGLDEESLRAMFGLFHSLFADSVRRGALESARREIDFIYTRDVRCLYFTDPDYPQRLLHCDDAPPMLYVSGRCDLNAPQSLAVVGTRHATPYGTDFTDRLITSLADEAERPTTIVSGLAFGIDIAAHRAALKHGLPTVAVMAHGLNTIYPAQHRQTAVEIVKSGGAVVTEYLSSSAVHKGNFLARNRIVAGLSDAVAVVESALKGGALATARLGAEYNREVFALPGRMADNYSRGCNHLIASNVAQLIEGADSIMKQMGWPAKRGITATEQHELFPPVSPEEQAILDYLAANDTGQLNLMVASLGIPVGKLLALLVDMEFKGMVTKYPGSRFRLR